MIGIAFADESEASDLNKKVHKRKTIAGAFLVAQSTSI